MHKKITKDFLIKKYIEENLSMKEVANILSCSISTVSRSVNKFWINKKIKRNKYNITKIWLEKEYIDFEKSQKEIADNIGCDQVLVCYYMKIFGIHTRTVVENFDLGKHPMLGKENKWGTHSEEHKRNMSERFSGAGNPMFGKKLSEEQKEKLSKRFSGSGNPMFGIKGEDSPVWKPQHLRKSNLYKQIRRSYFGKKWTNECMKRDGFSCKNCGDDRGGNLNVHHINFLSTIVKSNNILSLEDANKNKELWDTGNGITLCEICHHNVHKIINLKNKKK